MIKAQSSKRILSVILVLTMLLSMSGISAAAASATGPAVLTAGDISAMTETVTYANGVKITQQSRLSSIVHPSGGLVTMTVDGVETEINPGTYNGEVTFYVTDYLSDAALGSYTARVSAYGPDPYRTAMYIDNTGALVESKSAEISGSAGGYDADTKTISGLDIQSGESADDRTGSPEFSGVIIDAVGASATETYTIENSVINLYSDSDGTATEVSDFVGLGAAIAVYGPAKVILDNVDITTTGVAKLALFTDSGYGGSGNGGGISNTSLVGADVIVKDSTFEVKGGTLYDGYQNSANQNTMAAPPWVLGISGNARATNLEGGYSTNTFVDSTFKAAAWGVLSTDACTSVVLNVINSDVINTDKKQGGYGVYAIGSALETFYGVNFDVATYPVIITGGTAIFTSYTPGQQVDIYKDDANAAYNTTGSATYVDTVTSVAEAKVYTTVDSQFGVMWHGQGDVTVEDGTVFNTQNAAFLHKNGTVTLSVDDSAIDAADGVIVQMIDNDDSTVGATMVGGGPVFNKTFTETAGFPTTAARTSTSSGLTAEFTNVTLTGDMYNATGYYSQTPKAMDITLGEGAALEGVISASQAVHVWTVWDEDTQYYRRATTDDIPAIEALYGSGYEEITVGGVTYLQATAFTIDEYYNLGHVVNQPYSNGYNRVSVTLEDGAVWTVTGTSYLNSLMIDEASSIIAPEGYKVKMTVGGSETQIVAGQSYSGDIVIEIAEDGATYTDAAIFVIEVTYNQDVNLPEASKVVDTIMLLSIYNDTSITIKNLDEGTSYKQTVSTNGTTITVPDGLLATLTVDGVQYDFADFMPVLPTGGSQNSDVAEPIPAGSTVVITFTEDVYNLTNRGPGEGSGVYENFRMALYVEDDAVSDTASVKNAVTYSSTGTGIENVTIRSEGDNFNGILLKNSGSAASYYTIDNADISLVGNGGDDFQGWGAGIMITSTSGKASYVDITNSFITAEGALRSAIWASGQGTTDVNISDTVVIGYNADETTQSYQDLKVPMMKKVPWALGLEGNNRITSVLGKATVSYIDSIVVAEGWGALSTDSASSTSGLKGVTGTIAGIGSLEVAQEGKEYTVVKTVNGVTYGFTAGALGEYSGYVTYADTGVINEIADSEMYAPDYIMITAAGASGGEFTDVTAVTERIGFMWHQTSGGHLYLDGGSYTVADTMFMVKSTSNTGTRAYTDIAVDGADLNISGSNAQSGVLLQLMPSDDAGGIITSSYTITAEGVDTSPTSTTATAVNASFANVEVEGDVYNAIQAVKQNLNVSFTNSSVKGVISSSYTNHVDANGNILSEGTTVYATDDNNTGYLYAGRVVNTASPAVDNAVNLTLTGSTWTVTGTSYISSLTVDDTTVINGKIYLDGTKITVDDIITAGGTISGDIRVEADGSRTIVIDETTTYEDGLTIEEGDTYTPADGKLLTMTVGGVETKIQAGTYNGVVVMTVTDYLTSGSLASSSRRIAEPYRTAIYVVKSGAEAVLDSGSKSVKSAVVGGTYTAAAADGVAIGSGNGEDLVGTGSFSGIIINGNSASEVLEYTISDSVVNMLSDTDGTSTEVNDFQGLGSAIVAVGDVALTLDNIDVHTTGVAKPALFTDGGADVLVKNSTFLVEGGELYEGYKNSANTSVMVAPPWVLGISGNARGTNLLGNDSTNTFVDSSFTASGWGVLSTDGCNDVTMTVINSDLTINSSTGYGTYSIGFAVENFYGVTFDVATYAVVLREGTVTFSSHTEGTTYDIVNVQGGETVFADVASSYTGADRPSTVDSQFGVMWHASNLGTLILENGTVFDTRNAAFLNKDGQAKIYVDNSTVDVEDGVILQMIDDDDSLVGGFNPFNTSYSESAGFPSSVYGSASGTNYLTAEFTNVDLAGDMYNATGYRLQARPMSVTLGEGASLEGVISASNAAHAWMIWVEDDSDTQGGYYRYAENTDADKAAVEALGGTYSVITVDGTEYLQANYFTINEYYNLGHVVNIPNSNGYNTVNVTLKDGAEWTVTGVSYISSLTIDSASSIKAPGGYKVVMTVDGTAVDIAAGEYSGNIVLIIEESDEPLPLVSWVIRNNDPEVEQRILANSAYVVNGHDTAGTSDDTITDNRAGEEKGTSTYTSSSEYGASAIYVTNYGAAILSDITVNGNGTMSSADTSAEYSSKYGYASAILVNNGGMLTLYNPTINGIPDSYANGAYASDAGSTLYIYGGTINTNNRFGHGLDATYGGTIYAEDMYIHTRGSNSGAIATDFQGGFITVNDSEIISEAAGSPGIYTAGNSIITVSNSTVTANGTEGVMIAHDGGYTYLYDTDVTGVIGLNSHNSMVPMYSYLFMEGGSLTSTAGALITVSGGMADMTLDGVDIAIANGYDFIGAGQGSLIVTAKNMEAIVGDVTMNRTTYLELNLVNGGLEGSIDASTLTLANADWIVTETSYLSSLTIDETSSITAPEGYAVIMTVDSEKAAIAPGTYVGEVVLSLEEEGGSDIEAEAIRINSAAIVTLRKNATLQLDVTVAPEGANPAIVWTSSNPSIASVDENGLVTAYKTGTVVITAATADGSLTSSITVRVTV